MRDLAHDAVPWAVGHPQLASTRRGDVLGERGRRARGVDGALGVHEVFDGVRRREPDVVAAADAGVEDMAVGFGPGLGERTDVFRVTVEGEVAADEGEATRAGGCELLVSMYL